MAGDYTASPGDYYLLGLGMLPQFCLEEGAVVTDGVGDEDPLWRDIALLCQCSVQQALERFGTGTPELLGWNHAPVYDFDGGPDF